MLVEWLRMQGIASLLAFFDNRYTITLDDVDSAYQLVEYSMNERLRYLDINNGEKSDSQKLSEWLVNYCKKKNCNKLAYATAQSRVSPKYLRKKQNFELIAEELEAKKHIKISYTNNVRYININPQLLTGK